jgi:alkanesulfonate monooxygenase SsuD/methylene tetrahydromethanopterin reductase-like flavin-dependent oxidoreductase (luciferase family)
MSRIKFGVVIPQGWRWLSNHGDSSIEQYEFSKRIAILADTLHYHSGYVYDHLWGGSIAKNNRDKNFFECFTLLSAIIENTKRIRIGQAVTCNPYRSPALVSKIISTLDVMSRGRIELGIGAGWAEEEYNSFGFPSPYPSAPVRIRQLDEALAIIKLMWTNNDATFSGQYYSIKGAVCYPKPLQIPWPTILVGGSGERYLLKVAAKYADRYNIPFTPSPELAKNKISVLRGHCDTIGRQADSIENSIIMRCLIGKTQDDIQKKVEKSKIRPCSLDYFKQSVAAIVGTPEQLIAHIHRYIDIGISHFIMDFIGLDEESVSLFDSMVIEKV